MTILSILTLVVSFIASTAPVAVAVGLLGHALTASKWPWVQRVGLVLEGIGTDWRRVAQAFAKEPK